MKIKKGVLTADYTNSEILAEGMRAMEKAGFQEEECILFTEKTEAVLQDYYERFGEGIGFEYTIYKRFGRIELKLGVPGEKYDPLKEGKNSQALADDRSVYQLIRDNTVVVSSGYYAKRNLVTVYSPRIRRREVAVKSPVVWAVVSGIIAGLVFRRLPEGISSFATNDLATPVFSLIVGMMSGIMGPVIFLSLIRSISSLGSINRLTDLGTKILWRFIRTTCFVMALSICVSLFFYRSFSLEGDGINAGPIIQLLLAVFPTNIIKPFTENNTPQLVILGFAFGTALLMLGDRASDLNRSLNTLSDWLGNVVHLIHMLGPVIPGISIFISIAGGNASSLLDGWEFLLAIYIATTISVVFKLVKVSVKCGISISALWKKVKPLFARAFVTGSESATMMLEYELSEKDQGIDPEFSRFWIPMGMSMLDTRATIHLIIAPFLIAKTIAMPITFSFLLTLVILTLELSVACPGVQSSWVILFEALTLPAHYVGIFTVYKMMTTNYGCGCNMAYRVLEQIEIAGKMNVLDKSFYEEKAAA